MNFSILFFLRKHRVNKRGKAPLMCRLTYGGKRKEFSTRIFISSENWNASEQLIYNCRQSKLYNKVLLKLREEIEERYLLNTLYKRPVSSNTIYKEVFGGAAQHSKNIDDFVQEFLSYIKDNVGTVYQESTYRKYRASLRLILTVIDKSKLLCDITVNDIDPIIEKLHTKEYKTPTINKAIKILTQALKYAVKKEFITSNPLNNLRLKSVRSTISYLNQEELYSLEKHKISSSSQEAIKDCFLFSCYTGLAYNEAKNMLFSECYKDNHGQTWYKVLRKKTGRSYDIPLLPKAIKIIDKYKAQGLKKLPLISNQKFNDYIKEVCQNAGITKKVTHHMARKTFASTVLLGQGVSMEVVSKLLGHSSTAVTEAAYADVSKRLVYDTLKKSNILHKD